MTLIKMEEEIIIIDISMKKFEFVGSVTVSCFTTVEADTLEEALEIAEERMDEIDKANWQDHRYNEMWLVDELDGMVKDITLNN